MCALHHQLAELIPVNHTVQQPDRAPPKEPARAAHPAALEDAPHRRRVRDPGNRDSVTPESVPLLFLVVASLVSLDASGPRRARARYSPSQPHTRRRDTAARSRRQRGPAAPLTRDTANGLALVGLFYWRWGAFDGPPPSKNAGMHDGELFLINNRGMLIYRDGGWQDIAGAPALLGPSIGSVLLG